MLDVILKWLSLPVLGLISWGWKHINKRVDDVKKHADTQDASIRADMQRENERFHEEQTRIRDINAKIFDKLDEMKSASEARHREQMQGQFNMMQQFHTALAQKADK